MKRLYNSFLTQLRVNKGPVTTLLLVLLCLYLVVYLAGISEELGDFLGPASVIFGIAELKLYALSIILFIPLLLVIRKHKKRQTYVAISQAPMSEAEGRLTRLELLVWSVSSILISASLGSLRLWTRITDDEEAYRLQARLLMDGGVTGEALMPIDQVGNPFILQVPGTIDQWSGTYPFFAGLWTLPGEAIGFPNLIWLLTTGLIVYCGTRSIEEVLCWVRGADNAMQRSVSRSAAFLLASSPLLLGIGSIMHTAQIAALLGTLVVGTVARIAVVVDTGLNRSQLMRASLLLGLSLGAFLCSRPFEISVVVPMTGLMLLAILRNEGIVTLAKVAAMVACPALAVAAIQLGNNTALTGHPLAFPYSLLYGGTPVYGFGDTAYGHHDLMSGIYLCIVQLTRLSFWANGHPLGLLVAAAIAISLLRHGHRRIKIVTCLCCVFMLLHVLAYIPAPYGEVSAMGMTYSAIRVVIITLLLTLFIQSRPHWHVPIIIITVYGVMTVWPIHAFRLPELGEFIRSPVEQAKRLADENGKVAIVYVPFDNHFPYHSEVYFAPLQVEKDPAIRWIALSESSIKIAEISEIETLTLPSGRKSFLMYMSGDTLAYHPLESTVLTPEEQHEILVRNKPIPFWKKRQNSAKDQVTDENSHLLKK